MNDFLYEYVNEKRGEMPDALLRDSSCKQEYLAAYDELYEIVDFNNQKKLDKFILVVSAHVEEVMKKEAIYFLNSGFKIMKDIFTGICSVENCPEVSSDSINIMRIIKDEISREEIFKEKVAKNKRTK